MSDFAKLSFKVKRHDNKNLELFLTVRLDGEEKIPATSIVGPNEHCFTIDFPDDIESEHTLEIEMSGKTYAHVEIGPNGETISDTMLEFSDFTLEDIEIDYPLTSQSVYRHSFNNPDPNAEVIEDLFANAMGCNGIVTFKFTTPAFIWLLENV